MYFPPALFRSGSLQDAVTGPIQEYEQTVYTVFLTGGLVALHGCMHGGRPTYPAADQPSPSGAESDLLDKLSAGHYFYKDLKESKS